MDEETGRRLCSLIAGVICSDGQMAADERAFLKKVLQQLGLETDTALMPTYEGDVAAELAQLPEELRWDALRLVIEAAAVDGKVLPSERAIIDIIAGHLGVSQADIDERLAHVLAGG